MNNANLSKKFIFINKLSVVRMRTFREAHSPIGRQWRGLHDQQRSNFEKLEKMGVAGYFEWYTKDFTEEERRVADLAKEKNVSVWRQESNGMGGWSLRKHVDGASEPLLGHSEDPRSWEEVEAFLKDYRP
jgi:hypothetical protein